MNATVETIFMYVGFMSPALVVLCLGNWYYGRKMQDERDELLHALQLKTVQGDFSTTTVEWLSQEPKPKRRVRASDLPVQK